MTTIDISYQDLMALSENLSSLNDEFTQLYNNFLKDKKDDYYFCGREPVDVKYVEIIIIQLKKILEYLSHTNKRLSTSYDKINTVYQAGRVTGQVSVFLYGRMRN